MTRTEAEARVAAALAWRALSSKSKEQKAVASRLADTYPWLPPSAALLEVKPDDSPLTDEQWLRAGWALGVKPADLKSGKAELVILDGRLAIVGDKHGKRMGPPA